jgi:hypothetical protein
MPVTRGPRGLAYDADQADAATRQRLLSNRESAERSRLRKLAAEAEVKAALARCEEVLRAERAEVAALRGELAALRAVFERAAAAAAAGPVPPPPPPLVHPWLSSF